MERHLTFLVECRGAFGSIKGLNVCYFFASFSLNVLKPESMFNFASYLIHYMDKFMKLAPIFDAIALKL